MQVKSQLFFAELRKGLKFEGRKMEQFLHFCGFMRKCPSLLLLVPALLLANALQAQIEDPAFPGAAGSSSTKDSVAPVKRSDPGWQYATALAMGQDSFYRWDSSFVQVQRYNRLIRNAVPFTDLGVTASPHKLLHIPASQNPGFFTGLNAYPLYNKTQDSFRFYRAAVPLSRFYYTQGGKGVFMFEAMHTQNFSPNWNISVDFSSAQNGEVYTNSKQNHLHRGLAAGSSFRSRNGRYYQNLVLIWNTAKRNENRGLASDSIFFSPENFTKDSGFLRSEGNYLPASSTASSAYNQRHHRLEQQFAINENKRLFLFHRFDWIKEKYQYTEESENFSDLDSIFYGSPRFQDGSFKDSSVWVQWNNSFGIMSPHNVLHWPLKFRLWYSAGRIAYNSVYKTTPNLYLNQALHFSAETGNADTKLQTRLNLTQYFSGRNSGDYLAEAAADYIAGNNLKFSGQIRSQKFHAPFIAERFSSNYLVLNTNLKPINLNAAEFSGSWLRENLRTRFTAFAANYAHFVYNDPKGRFAQTALTAAGLRAEVELRLGRFYISNQLSLQKHNQRSLIPYPAFSDLLGLYYQGPLFKKAMNARIGVDLWYMSEYTGYHYNPLNTVFYPGQDKAGHYPWVDVYISGEVKTLMFFIKTEHINANLMNYGFNDRFISALNYPGEPFRLRFGFIWRFYN